MRNTYRDQRKQRNLVWANELDRSVQRLARAENLSVNRWITILVEEEVKKNGLGGAGTGDGRSVEADSSGPRPDPFTDSGPPTGIGSPHSTAAVTELESVPFVEDA